MNTAARQNDGCIFQTLRESRGSYFTEYTPARAGEYFASLALVFTEKPTREEIPATMERECTAWIQRFRVPVMATALDDHDGIIPLHTEREWDHLIALPETDGVRLRWESLSNDEFPSGAWNESELLDIYRDIPHTTHAERARDAVSSSTSIRASLILIAIWIIAGPVAVALIGFANPLLGGLIIVYSLSKAGWHIMKLLGYLPHTKRETQELAQALRMRHHHYHCERNPEGFMRLKAENLERDVKEQTHREADELKRLQSQLEDDA